jgi:copper oxidase (laccase) domain-containing protein
MEFTSNNQVILLGSFPGKTGITTIFAGDFSKTNPSKEIIQDRQLTNYLGGDFYHKIYPVHGDKIIFTDNCGAYQYCDALVSYQEKPKAEVLISITGDSPTIVLSARNQKLIAIIHSGWRETELKIVPKTFREIFKKTGIRPEEISVGIFRGICNECYEVKDDVGKKFPESFKNGHLDLRHEIISQLFDLNVDASHLCCSGLGHCSYHSRDDFNRHVLFSHRRDPRNTDRNAVFIMRNPS